MTRRIAELVLLATGLLVPALLVDAVRPLPPSVRRGVFAIGLSSIMIGAATTVRSAIRPVRLSTIATIVEQAVPSQGERLSAAAAFLDAGNERRESLSMTQALIKEANRGANLIRSGAIPLGTSPGPKVFAALSVVTVLAWSATVSPDYCRVLVARAMLPWRDVDPPSRYVIRLFGGDRTVHRGAEVTVSAEILSRFAGHPPSDVSLERLDPDGKVGYRFAMSPIDQRVGRFSATLPKLTESAALRVTADDEKGTVFHVKVVDALKLTEVSARVEPPAYTKRAPELAGDPSRILALEGSRIVLAVSANKTLESLDLNRPEGANREENPAFALLPDRRGGAIVAAADVPGAHSFKILARSREHGEERLLQTYRLIVRPDRPPTISARWIEAREVSFDDVVLADLAIRDDFAVTAVEWDYRIRRGGSEPLEGDFGRSPTSLPGLGARAVNGEAKLDLKSLKLKPGDEILFSIRCLDNRPAPKGPNVSTTEERSLLIVEKAEKLEARKDRVKREGFRARLQSLKSRSESNRRETEQLRYVADSALSNPSAWSAVRDRELADRERETRDVGEGLQTIADDADVDPTVHPLAAPARGLAEAVVEPGRLLLERARRSTEAERRLAQLRQADGRLEQTRDGIEQLIRKFDELVRFDESRRTLRDLAERENEIAERSEVPPSDQAERDRIREAQEEVRRELDEVIKRSPDMRTAENPDEAKHVAESQAAARRALNDASKKLAESSTPKDATPAIRRAAEALQAASRPSELAKNQANRAREATESAAGPRSGEIAPGPADLSELQALARKQTGRRWGELPGHLRAEILSRARGRYRDDYERLIGLYFREIAGMPEPVSSKPR